ncbi:MAG TPA: hypothetical protein VED46_03090 [Alphaproteobacteria bacterium]|nr:hypothetical protein [Alphaproteobacteria bacterium]
MTREKLAATRASLNLLARSKVDAAVLLHPWHRAATANAKRLCSRGKRR